MRRLSLRLRLFLAGAGAVLAALGLAAFGLSALFGAHVERRARAELAFHLDQVLAGLTRETDGKLALATPLADPRFLRPHGGLYWQIDSAEGTLRSRSLWDYALPLPRDDLAPGSLHPAGLAQANRAKNDRPDGGLHVHELAGPAGETLLALERSVTLPARLGGTNLRATVAMDMSELAASRRAFLGDLAPYLAALALTLILAGWLQVTIGLRPLRAVGTRIAAVRSGRAARIGGELPREVEPLAGELDALLAAREADIARARARAGDLAHGLKTPLQALLGEARRLRQSGHPRQADGIEEVARAMQHHVERELARARLAFRARHARCDLAQGIAQVVSVIRRTPQGSELDWQIEAPEGLTLALESGDLAEALGALVENAAQHARHSVSISAHKCGRGTDGGVTGGARIAVIVRDDGPGIPPERIEALTRRGERADETTGGAGLGLAIASEIAEAVGGSLTLEAASPGLVTRLELPAAEPAGTSAS